MTIEQRGVLVVDLQPAFAKYHEAGYANSELVRATITMLKALDPGVPVVVLYVDEELSGDTLESIREFWDDHGADEELVSRIRWVEKTYTFLRGWMDNEIPDEEIHATLKALREKQQWDSRQLEEALLSEIAPNGCKLGSPLFREYPLEQLFPALQGSPWLTCGGGKDACLREVELVLESFDIEYSRIPELIY